MSDYEGNTCFHYALASNCSQDVVELLMTAGVNLFKANKKGQFAIDLCENKMNEVYVHERMKLHIEMYGNGKYDPIISVPSNPIGEKKKRKLYH